MFYNMVPKEKDSKLIFLLPVPSLWCSGRLHDISNFAFSPSLLFDFCSLSIFGSFWGRGECLLTWPSFVVPSHADLPHTAQDAPTSPLGAYSPFRKDAGSQAFLK